MGNLAVAVFAEAVKGGEIDLDAALIWHLRANHYPPLPISLLPVCKRAIKKANQGKWISKVRLPDNVYHRRYGKLVPVVNCIEDLHLGAFIEKLEV